jgi:hypothetical protein
VHAAPWSGGMDLMEPFEHGDALRQALRTALCLICEVTTLAGDEVEWADHGELLRLESHPETESS